MLLPPVMECSVHHPPVNLYALELIHGTEILMMIAEGESYGIYDRSGKTISKAFVMDFISNFLYKKLIL